MSVEKGVWLGENQKEVDAKIQNLDSNGNLTGDVTGDVTGSNFSPKTETYISDGVVDVSNDAIILNGGFENTALTLGTGIDGQRLLFFCVSSTNTCTLAYTAVALGAKIATFTSGDSLELYYSTSIGGWVLVSNNGASIA